MLISGVPTFLAWQFTAVNPGTFKRSKADFAHHDYPILAPLPSNGSNTRPLEEAGPGPFLYFVISDDSEICYVGKSKEESVLKRWIRPGTDRRYYWTHSTKSGGCVFSIAEGIHSGKKYELRYTPLLSVCNSLGKAFSLDEAEQIMIENVRPSWNLR